MADQARAPAMQRQARIALRAGRAPAAGMAQQHRRVATAVDEQQRLVARLQTAVERGQHRRGQPVRERRSEEHTSELQSLMRISYAVFCLKKKKKTDLQTQE